mmetsp:Transcript_31500/g.41646  ORF Transcript_31500/g.41646 Transcript_31500/m.41646 type:complete len:270 (-) Transcript_31500:358-1167(-)|eukprot:CAMPEP_0117759318 /NCGR_PEP_ID=MMETSP0947-20121206/15943_1 /TAXON_ID=44440 /ORGANISM="Chattonella subsalsa, Strain CCMP2191" /LENGTH=269 /DNA_ID=CAMNT_0005579755 /DNA_START=55 /DNA_END=864 /DNA_ORIENTATION=+
MASSFSLIIVLLSLLDIAQCFIFPLSSSKVGLRKVQPVSLNKNGDIKFPSGRPPFSPRKALGNSNSNDQEDEGTPSPNKSEPKNILETFVEWVQSEEGKEDLKIYATSLTAALLVRFFIAEPRWIPSLSMYPTFDIGDQLAVDKISKVYRPYQRRDVVVFMPPESFKLYSSKSEALIKRIVAIEGDVVEVKRDGRLYINGELQDEKYTAEDAEYTFGPYKVPAGNVLVLGDNRNRSLDGHIWGSLPKENIIGRAVFKYWPPWRIGGVAN